MFHLSALALISGLCWLAPKDVYAQQAGEKNKPTAQTVRQAEQATAAQAKRQRPRPYRPRHGHLVGQPEYWHPYYRHRPQWQIYAWNVVGYPYYPGGTNYVVQPTRRTIPESVPQVDKTVRPIRGLSKRKVSDRYVQLQEITDIIHEWRTLNESVEVHERVRMAMETSVHQPLVDSIKKTNKEFDQATRNAMYKLSSGRKADQELAEASRRLNQLQQMVKKLPAPPKPPEAYMRP
jgi:hypothetical protein